MSTTEPRMVRIDLTLNSGCYCNLFYCEHRFRALSLGWYKGLRRNMPLVNHFPNYLFRVTA